MTFGSVLVTDYDESGSSSATDSGMMILVIDYWVFRFESGLGLRYTMSSGTGYRDYDTVVL